MTRVILTAKAQISPISEYLATKLVETLTEVCKNPSQPSFNHFLFESISAITR